MHVYIHPDIAISLSATPGREFGHIGIEILVKPDKHHQNIKALCKRNAARDGVKGEFKVKFIFPTQNDRNVQIEVKGDKCVPFHLFAGRPERIELVEAKLAEGFQLKNHEMLPEVRAFI